MGINSENQNNTGVEIRDKKRNNIKNYDEDSQDKVGDSEAIAKYGNNQSDTDK